MEGHAGEGINLFLVVALLGAAVIAVPIFKRLGLGSVLGYLAAGLVIGPYTLGLFQDPETILHVAELGVVMLLFVIGLEMNPGRLWSLRKDIFGLGVAQVLFCGALLSGVAMLAGYSPAVAFVAAAGFILSSTAIVMQILEERGETLSKPGQKIVSILLLEDLAIVPLLAVVAFLAPGDHEDAAPLWLQAVTAVVAIAGLIFAGRYVLTPLFRVIAATRAREIMTATALLVVLGAAVAMEAGGLSMAMGAFVAGVVLSESSYRHELEADIEPFRGLLLGLFFLSVGMSLNLPVIAESWPLVLAIVVAFMIVKSGGIYVVARVFRANHRDALQRAFFMAQGGEFAFVLYSAAGDASILDPQTSAILTAAVIVSMALTPLGVILLDQITPKEETSLDGVEAAEGLTGTALIIGFGRFGQLAAQALLAKGVDVTIIDSDPDMIRSAARFGFKIYYGDGTRIDVLRAAGAGDAKVILICTDGKEAATQIVEVARVAFPLAQLFVRSFDRGHSLELRGRGVDFEIRETLLSAIELGKESLIGLGVSREEAEVVAVEVRRRDMERLRLQELDGNFAAGRELVFRAPVPTPLLPVRRESRPLNQETAMVADTAAEPEPPIVAELPGNAEAAAPDKEPADGR